MSGLKKVSILPAREQVASILRQAIILRKFKEGQDLTLKEAAEMVGSSITPVREAFQILENEGWIELRPNKGAVILGVTEQTIRDHYETRKLLEAYAARQACRPNADISGIVEAHDLAEVAINTKGVDLYRECNIAFHMSIWRAAGNKRIENILSSLWNGFSLGNMITEDEYLETSWEEHKEIYSAILSHDGAMAELRMREHIERSMNDALTRYAKEYDF